MMQYSIIRSQENGSVAGDKSRLHAPLSRTKSTLTYDGQPSYVVSIMEFDGGRVAHETQYFGDAFEPGPSRAQWVEPIP